MSGTLPLVRGNAQALCPVTRRVEFLTDVAIALNRTEQRFKKRGPLTSFTFPYTRLPQSDKDAMAAFFESQKGTFDTTWSVTLGTTTYSDLTFTDDTFSAREDSSTPCLYGFTLHARQVKNASYTIGSAGGNFPTLTHGYKAQLPYVQMRRFDVLVCDNPIGPRYSYTWTAGGLSGFPTRGLKGWELSFPALTDTDLGILETHYRNQFGRFSQFQFTDPDDNTAYPKCRYDSDVLEISHFGVHSSLTLRIMETN